MRKESAMPDEIQVDCAKLRKRLVDSFMNARAVCEADKGTRSEAFDSGRYDGLKEALAVLDDYADYVKRHGFQPLR